METNSNLNRSNFSSDTQGNSDLLHHYSKAKKASISEIDAPLELILPHPDSSTLDCHENHGTRHDLGEEEGEEEDDYDGGYRWEVGSRHISKER